MVYIEVLESEVRIRKLSEMVSQSLKFLYRYRGGLSPRIAYVMAQKLLPTNDLKNLSVPELTLRVIRRFIERKC